MHTRGNPAHACFSACDFPRIRRRDEDIGGDGDVAVLDVWVEGGYQEAGHVEVLDSVCLVGVEQGLVAPKKAGIGGAP